MTTDETRLRFFAEGESVLIGYVSSLNELLRAIDETMPKDAILYVEGTTIVREIKGFLISRQAEDLREIDSGGGWPKPNAYHMPLAGTNLAELRGLAEHQAAPEVCDTLVVYCGDGVLLWAHDAGYGYVELTRSLPEETTERFRAALGEALAERKPSPLRRMFSR